jgi:hypothetical protein
VLSSVNKKHEEELAIMITKEIKTPARTAFACNTLLKGDFPIIFEKVRSRVKPSDLRKDLRLRFVDCRGFRVMLLMRNSSALKYYASTHLAPGLLRLPVWQE